MNKIAPLTQSQTDYLYRTFDSWLNVAEGGKRGGKNVLQVLAFCMALEEHPDHLHMIAGVSTSTASLNIIECDGYGMMNYFEGRCKEGKYKDRPCLYISTKTGTKVVLISGGGKDGDEKKIKGNTYGMAYITEVNECSKKFVDETFDRTLSSSSRKIFHDLNPKAESHWYYKEILNFHQGKQEEDPTYGYNYGHFTIADNMSISDDRLKEILNTYDKNTIWYQRDILGERKQAEGLVYPSFDEKLHVYSGDPPKTSPRYIAAIDFGMQNPTVYLGIADTRECIYIEHEYYYDGREESKEDKDKVKTVSDLGNDFVEFTRKWGHSPSYVIVDPSAVAIKNELKRNRFKVKDGENSVNEGIEKVSVLLSRGQIKVHESCKNTIREFQSYSWDSKASEKDIDKPIKQNDHTMDALRYFCMSLKERRYTR